MGDHPSCGDDMGKTLLKAFWACGDNEIIEFAIHKARLNRHERDVVFLILDECKTQEQAAEMLDTSTRHLQEWWYSANRKLLGIPWVMAYAKELIKDS